MIVIKPSTPFSNGMSYEFFIDNFCYRCKHGKINESGFVEYPEKGGCKIWDSIERARFDLSVFPCEDVVQIEKDGTSPIWHACKHFESDDESVMSAYKKLFEEDCE